MELQYTYHCKLPARRYIEELFNELPLIDNIDDTMTHHQDAKIEGICAPISDELTPSSSVILTANRRSSVHEIRRLSVALKSSSAENLNDTNSSQSVPTSSKKPNRMSSLSAYNLSRGSETLSSVSQSKSTQNPMQVVRGFDASISK